VTAKTFTELALSFPAASEQPHFEKLSYRVNKKIFATLDLARNNACLKLGEIDQSVFCLVDPAAIYPVPNKWGKQGWTIIELGQVKKTLVKDMLTKSYDTCCV
jgi:predicted DNA-binding protein (MmcQ/YjbR family)